MKWYHLVFLISIVLLSGCSFLDTAFGTDAEGNPTGGGGIVGTVGGLAKTLGFGGVNEVLLGLGLFWSHIRGRRYKKVAITGIQTFDQVRQALEDKKLTDAEMLKIAKALQHDNGTKDATKDLLALARKKAVAG